MTVSELIEKLKELPQDRRVFMLIDGEPRSALNVVYESKTGRVVVAGYGHVVYSTNARPVDAPTRMQDNYWRTEEDPNILSPEDDWDF